MQLLTVWLYEWVKMHITNRAIKSRLLRFRSKFKGLSNGHILVNVSTLLKQAMIQNKGPECNDAVVKKLQP